MKHRLEKGPLRFRPSHKRMGAAFMVINSLERRPRLERSSNMMGLNNFLSPDTITCIARGSYHLEQTHDFSRDKGCMIYSVEVYYPNGYGVHIACYPHGCGYATEWNVCLLTKDGCLDEEDDEFTTVNSEEEIIHFCDNAYFRLPYLE